MLPLSEQLGAVAVVIGEMREEFEGDDVLVEMFRYALDEAVHTLAEVHQGIQEFTGQFELPEPGPSLEDARALAKLAAE